MMVERNRKQLLPPSMRTPQTALRAVVYRIDRAVWVAAFHGLRVPAYYARVAQWAPLGAWVVVRAVARVLSAANDRDTLEAVKAGVRASGTGAPALVGAHRRYLHRLAWLAGVSVVAAVALVLVVWWGWSTWTPATKVIVGVVMVAALGGIGAAHRPVPILDPISDSGQAPPLSKDLIVEALDKLGIAQLTAAIKDDPRNGVRMMSPVIREGMGWRAEIELPSGVTADDVISRRSKLASGLKRSVGQCWPAGHEGQHEGRLVLFVSDDALADQAPEASPLLRAPHVNMFEPFPVGRDPRGNEVKISLMFASMVVGAVPRAGKTAFLRVVAAASALDPRTQLHIANLKGGADFRPLARVAATYLNRCDPDKGDLDKAVAMLVGIQTEMRRRYELIETLEAEAPDAKLTDELASRRDLGLAPILLIVDECQGWFDDKKAGSQIANLAEDLVRRGPAVGIMAIFATQRVDAKSLPTGISSNAVLRFCLRVTGQIENDMVLGTSMYKAGIRATEFSRRDLGVGWLVGDGDEPTILRAHYLDLADTDAIVEVALARRKKLGWHTATDDGTEETDEPQTLVDHVAMVWPAGVDRMWTSEILEALTDRWPGAYGDWSTQTLGGALADVGVATKNIRRDGKTRKGITATDFAAVYQSAAVAQRLRSGRRSR